MDSISKANKEKYKHPPSIEMMRQKAEEECMSLRGFASHYGIPSSFFRMVLAEMKVLPPKYWHIFYETAENNMIFLQKIEKQAKKSALLATLPPKVAHQRLKVIMSLDENK